MLTPARPGRIAVRTGVDTVASMTTPPPARADQEWAVLHHDGVVGTYPTRALAELVAATHTDGAQSPAGEEAGVWQAVALAELRRPSP